MSRVFGVGLLAALVFLASVLAATYAAPCTVTVRVVKDGKEINGAYIEIWNATLVAKHFFKRGVLIAKGLSPLNCTLEEGQNYIIYVTVNATTYEFKIKNFTSELLKDSVLELKITTTTMRYSSRILLAVGGAFAAFVVFAVVVLMNSGRRGRRRRR